MTHPIHKPILDEVRLKQMLRKVVESKMDSLPKPLEDAAWGMFRATSSADLSARAEDLKCLGIDWSRSGPTVSGWNADYCNCVFCGQQAANKKGIVDHMCVSECSVFGAVVMMARADYCDSDTWKHEVANENRNQEDRDRTLCLVDLDAGPERLQLTFRAREDLTAAESRLTGLGFEKTVRQLSGNRTETRWEMVTDTAQVLADPREEGRIYIRAWPINAKPATKRKRRLYSAPEYILDIWHKDLPAKLHARIEKQLAAR